jgi:biopolymer transport protein ExbB/TolQ
VAIPAIVFYHYFEGRVDSFSSQMKDAASELLVHQSTSAPVKDRKYD